MISESRSLLFSAEEEVESDQFPKMGVLGSGGGVDLAGGKSISTACSNGFVQGRTQNYKWSLIKGGDLVYKRHTFEGSFISIQAPSISIPSVAL